MTELTANWTREKQRAANKRYREKHPGLVKEQHRKYHEAHREEIRARKRSYINVDGYKAKCALYRKRYHERHPEALVASRKKYNERHPEAAKESSRRYRENNREKVIAARIKDRNRQKQWRENNRDKIKQQRISYKATHTLLEKARRLRKYYGISLDDFQKKIDEQGGACAICRKPGWGRNKPCLDHDHKTGQIRSVLCAKCNLVLGLIGDDSKIALALAEYLITHSSRGTVCGRTGEGR
jgi:hypothetical protein